MIFSERFIWLHFPKCAGHETERALKGVVACPNAVNFDPIDPAHVIWHDSVAERRQRDPAFDWAGRDIICNIRRLPLWILSRIHYEKARNPHLVATESMFLTGRFFEADGRVASADAYMQRYSAPRPAFWLRTEHLARDFTSVFSRYLAASDIRARAVFHGLNQTVPSYVKDPAYYFTNHQLRKLYNHNPLWAKIEAEVYGDLLTL